MAAGAPDVEIACFMTQASSFLVQCSALADPCPGRATNASERAATRKGAPHRDRISKFQIASVGDAACDARHRDAQRRQLPFEEKCGGFAVHARGGGHDDL